MQHTADDQPITIKIFAYLSAHANWIEYENTKNAEANLLSGVLKRSVKTTPICDQRSHELPCCL